MQLNTSFKKKMTAKNKGRQKNTGFPPIKKGISLSETKKKRGKGGRGEGGKGRGEGGKVDDKGEGGGGELILAYSKMDIFLTFL